MKAPFFASALLLVATAAGAQDGMTLKGITLGTDIDDVTVGLLLDGWIQTDLHELGAGMIYDPQKKMAQEMMPIGHLTEGEPWSSPLISYLGFDRDSEALEIIADARGQIQEITYVMDYANDGPFGDYDAAMAQLAERYNGPPTCGTSTMPVKRLTWTLDQDLKPVLKPNGDCFSEGIVEHMDIWATLSGLQSTFILPGIRVVSWLDTHEIGSDTVIDGMSITLQDVDAMIETMGAGFEAVRSAHPVIKVAPDF